FIFQAEDGIQDPLVTGVQTWALPICLNAETYITGHGDLVTKADLQRKFDATTARRKMIAAMIKEGKTLDEIKAALPDPPAPGAEIGRASCRDRVESEVDEGRL